MKWIVVANRTEARIYNKKSFMPLNVLYNDLGREKNHAFTTDKPGWSRGKFSHASGPHALTGEKNPHNDAAIQFARQLCRHLKHQFDIHNFFELQICAEPKMMGYIRAHLDPQLMKWVEWTPKDFSYFNDTQIAEALGYEREQKFAP